MERWAATEVAAAVDRCYEKYDLTGAVRQIADFTVDDVSNWYVRLNRRRFWGTGQSDDKLDAFATLALAELYGAVDDPRVGPALQRAVTLILEAQKRNQKGAWRYRPESNDADTTVSGGQSLCSRLRATTPIRFRPSSRSPMGRCAILWLPVSR